MVKKKKTNVYDSIEEDIMNISSKEEEIMRSYNELINDEDEEIEEIIIEDDEDVEDEVVIEEPEEEEEETTEEKITNIESYEYNEDDEDNDNEEDKIKKYKRIINIVFSIIVIILLLIAIDIVAVAKFNVGPFFTIPVHTYNDGGTKEYYGLGYKVIKYHQTQGRRDRELGSWSLKYKVEPITFQAVDFAIEFSGNEAKTYEKYYKSFVRIISTLEKVDTKNNKIYIGYLDEGEKYSLEIVCNMVKEQKNIDKLEVGKETTIIGSIRDFKPATKKQPNTLYINDCFAEQ